MKKKVAVITCHWGDDNDDRASAMRLISGAASRNFTVEIIHLNENISRYTIVKDSVFTVHRLPVADRNSLRSDLIKVALASYDNGRKIPGVAAETIAAYDGKALFVTEALTKISPDVILLGGLEQLYDVSELHRIAATKPTKIIALPVMNELTTEFTENQLEMLRTANIIAALSPGEENLLKSYFPNKVTSLHIAFNINRHAAKNMLFGVRYFNKYVLLIRSFPPSTQRFSRSLTHEVLKTAIEPFSVAEVDNEQWRISDDQNTLKLPVSASRVNLWRLMAHAQLTVDLRPPRPLGREAIESMLLGTPVIVHRNSIAYEHVKAANGGFWYSDYCELIQTIRIALDPTMNTKLRNSASEYSKLYHGDSTKFIEEIQDLFLN